MVKKGPRGLARSAGSSEKPMPEPQERSERTSLSARTEIREERQGRSLVVLHGSVIQKHLEMRRGMGSVQRVIQNARGMAGMRGVAVRLEGVGTSFVNVLSPSLCGGHVAVAVGGGGVELLPCVSC